MDSVVRERSILPSGNTASRLNVGCGRNILDGWLNLDSSDLEGVDIRFNLEESRRQQIPLPNDSLDEFLLSHVIEHINDPLAVMQELYRLAKPGATCTIRVPHGASDDAWEDQTHLRAYFPNSFQSFSQPYYWRADYGYRADWRTDKVQLLMRKADCQAMTVDQIMGLLQRSRNVVVEMVAVLTAVKPAREPKGELQTRPTLDIITI